MRPARCCGSRRRPSCAAAPRASGWCPAGAGTRPAAGTNGIGMALVTGRPAAVFATEHWVSPVRDWVCYSAPVRTPDGTMAGVIDLSTTWDRANPLGLGTIAAFARLIEVELGQIERRRRPTWARPARARPAARHARRRRRSPSARASSSCIVALAIVGAATLDELHALLYGDRPVSRATLRAEISHTRDAARWRHRLAAVPPHRAVSGSTPSTCSSGCAAATSTGAVERYGGPLLPASDAPLDRRAALPPRRGPAHRPAARRIDGAAPALRAGAPVRRRGAAARRRRRRRRTIPTCPRPSPPSPSPPPTSRLIGREPATSRGVPRADECTDRRHAR